MNSNFCHNNKNNVLYTIVIILIIILFLVILRRNKISTFSKSKKIILTINNSKHNVLYLEWTEIPNVPKYNIYRSPNADFQKYQLLATVNTNKYVYTFIQGQCSFHAFYIKPLYYLFSGEESNIVEIHMKCFPQYVNNIDVNITTKNIVIDPIIFTDHNIKAFDDNILIESIKFKYNSSTKQYIYNYKTANKLIINPENSCGLGQGIEIKINDNSVDITKFKPN